MIIKRRTFSVAMGFAVLMASAFPVFADASQLESSPGVLAPVGTVLTATSTNFQWTTSWGPVVCAEVIVKSRLSKNSGGAIEAFEEGVGTTRRCHLGQNELPITELTLRLRSTELGSGAIGLTYTAHLSGGVKCTYTGSAVPFTYGGGSSSIKVDGKLKPSPTACGLEPTTIVSAEFALAIGSTPVILN